MEDLIGNCLKEFTANVSPQVSDWEFYLVSCCLLSSVEMLTINWWFAGNAEDFCSHVFRTFDSDNNGFIDFKEFLLAIDVTSAGSPEQKLNWAFRYVLENLSSNIFKSKEANNFYWINSITNIFFLPPSPECMTLMVTGRLNRRRCQELFTQSMQWWDRSRWSPTRAWRRRSRGLTASSGGWTPTVTAGWRRESLWGVVWRIRSSSVSSLHNHWIKSIRTRDNLYSIRR